CCCVRGRSGGLVFVTRSDESESQGPPYIAAIAVSQGFPSPGGVQVKRHYGIRALLLISSLLGSQAVFASNHREAPITALDQKADITPHYAFDSSIPSSARVT